MVTITRPPYLPYPRSMFLFTHTVSCKSCGASEVRLSRKTGKRPTNFRGKKVEKSMVMGLLLT